MPILTMAEPKGDFFDEPQIGGERIYPSTYIYVCEVDGKGFGVFASRAIHSGTTIEVCPIFRLSKKDSEYIRDNSDTFVYYYLEQTEHREDVIMLGNASLYNHSTNPNAEIDYDSRRKTRIVRIVAITDIMENEEITIDYNFENNETDFTYVD